MFGLHLARVGLVCFPSTLELVRVALGAVAAGGSEAGMMSRSRCFAVHLHSVVFLDSSPLPHTGRRPADNWYTGSRKQQHHSGPFWCGRKDRQRWIDAWWPARSSSRRRAVWLQLAHACLLSLSHVQQQQEIRGRPWGLEMDVEEVETRAAQSVHVRAWAGAPSIPYPCAPDPALWHCIIARFLSRRWRGAPQHW